MNPWGLLGHDRAVRSFRGSREAGRLAHAYLITGVPGVGRRTFAARMAQELRCQEPDPPCLTCLPCAAIDPDGSFWRAAIRRDHPDELPDQAPRRERRDAGYVLTSYIDLAVLRKSDGHRDIPIRGVRELTAESHLKPAHGPTRGAIIDAADEMNDHAANALLKTLEQPASHAVIILLAPRVDRVLPTIASRCRHIPLTPVPMDVISAHLARDLGAEPDVAAAMATASRGRVGWAIRMAQDPNRWQAFTESQAKADEFESATPSDRFMAVDELIGRGRPLEQAEQASEWLEHIRSVNAVRLRAALRNRTPDSERQATMVLSAVVARMLRARDAQSDILRNVTPRLVFEDLALRPADDARAT